MPDEYGTFQINQNDADIIRDLIALGQSVVFPMTGDRYGAMIVLICPEFVKLGIMPFGGKPDDRLYVGIYGRGCGHFSKAYTHHSYLAEKLGLESNDAVALAGFWNLIFPAEPTT